MTLNNLDSAENYAKEGGFAFPCGEYADHGMSLRDYFAAKALQGLIANGLDKSVSHVVSSDFGKLPMADGLAKLCYTLSDSMIKARSE